MDAEKNSLDFRKRSTISFWKKKNLFQQVNELQKQMSSAEVDLCSYKAELEELAQRRHDLFVQSVTAGIYADLEAFEVWAKTANVPLGFLECFSQIQIMVGHYSGRRKPVSNNFRKTGHWRRPHSG